MQDGNTNTKRTKAKTMINHGDSDSVLNSGPRPTTDAERSELQAASTKHWSSDENRIVAKKLPAPNFNYHPYPTPRVSRAKWAIGTVVVLAVLAGIIAAIASM